MSTPHRTLHVSWHSPEPWHGIVAAELVNPCPDRVPERIWLEIDGREHPVEIGGLAPAARYPLNLHSHGLTDGEHEILVGARCSGSDYRSPAFPARVANPGALAARVAASLARHGTARAFLGPCDASRYDYGDADLTPWFDRPDADTHIDARLAEGLIDAAEAEYLRHFVRDGYLVLSERVPEALLCRVDEALDRAVVEGYQGYRYGDSTRLEHMHDAYPAVGELWRYPPVLRALTLIFEQPPEPCQSLVYVFGSQQDAHQDTIHLTPFPAGYMCGVWVALEDVRPGSGELLVYPGSHRLPRVYLKDSGCDKVRDDWRRFGDTVVRRWRGMLDGNGMQPVPYLAERGSILIWHENLMHAGSVRRDPSLSRRSMVSHHFARGSLAYYDSTGLVGHTTPAPQANTEEAVQCP